MHYGSLPNLMMFLPCKSPESQLPTCTSHRYWSTFDTHQEASVATARGGTILGIARRWTDDAISIRHEVLQRARAIGVMIELPGTKLAFASVHVDPAMNLSAKTRLFYTVRRWLDGCADCFAILLGDWNFIPSDEARLSGMGRETSSADRTGERFEHIFEDLAEIHQPHFTWSRRGADGMLLGYSRIDRAYARVDHLEAAQALWTAGIVGSLTARNRPSDHAAVSVSIRRNKGRSELRPPLPPYLFRLPEVWKLFHEYTSAHDLMPDPGLRLDAMVEELGRAAARVRSLPRQSMEGGLRGKADVVLRAVAHARRDTHKA